MAAATPVAVQVLSPFALAYGADLVGATVARVRGTLNVVGQTAGAAVNMIAAMGVFPASLTAANLDPGVKPHEDWMYWEALYAQPNIGTELSHVDMLRFDVRAMRRMEELEEDLYLVFKNDHATNVQSVQWSVSVLLMLP